MGTIKVPLEPKALRWAMARARLSPELLAKLGSWPNDSTYPSANSLFPHLIM